MQLTELARDVATRFAERKDIAKRLDFADALAKKYKFSPKELVLFYTHPTFSKLPLKERCEKLGFSEEEFAFYALQPGVKKFLQDLQELTLTSLRTQSFEKLGENIARDRVRFDKAGNQIDDFGIELEVLKLSAPEKTQQANPVNIQFNMWDRARAKAIEIKAEEV